jgi:hypothetical protein
MTPKLERRDLYYQAACALCRKDGQDPDELVEGQPRWTQHLPHLEHVARDCFNKTTIQSLYRCKD